MYGPWRRTEFGGGERMMPGSDQWEGPGAPGQPPPPGRSAAPPPDVTHVVVDEVPVAGTRVEWPATPPPATLTPGAPLDLSSPGPLAMSGVGSGTDGTRPTDLPGGVPMSPVAADSAARIRSTELPQPILGAIDVIAQAAQQAAHASPPPSPIHADDPDDEVLTLMSLGSPDEGEARRRSPEELFGRTDEQALTAVEALFSIPAPAIGAEHTSHMAWLGDHRAADRLDDISWQRISDHEREHGAIIPDSRLIPRVLPTIGWRGWLSGVGALVIASLLFGGTAALSTLILVELLDQESSELTSERVMSLSFAGIGLLGGLLALLPFKPAARRFARETGLMLLIAGWSVAWITGLSSLQLRREDDIAWAGLAVLMIGGQWLARRWSLPMVTLLSGLAVSIPLAMSLAIGNPWLRVAGTGGLWLLLLADVALLGRGRAHQEHAIYGRTMYALVASIWVWFVVTGLVDAALDGASFDRQRSAELGLFGLAVALATLLLEWRPADLDDQGRRWPMDWPMIGLTLPMLWIPGWMAWTLVHFKPAGLPETVSLGEFGEFSTWLAVAFGLHLLTIIIPTRGRVLGAYWARPRLAQRGRIAVVSLHQLALVMWLIWGLIDALEGFAAFVLLPLGLVALIWLLWRLGGSTADEATAVAAGQGSLS